MWEPRCLTALWASQACYRKLYLLQLKFMEKYPFTVALAIPALSTTVIL
jgi:hypothetical protein